MNAHTPITPEPRAFVATLPDSQLAAFATACIDRMLNRANMLLEGERNSDGVLFDDAIENCIEIEAGDPADFPHSLAEELDAALAEHGLRETFAPVEVGKALAHYGAMDADARTAAMVGAIFGVVGSSRS